jgi:hypothetical protein
VLEKEGQKSPTIANIVVLHSSITGMNGKPTVQIRNWGAVRVVHREAHRNLRTSQTVTLVSQSSCTFFQGWMVVLKCSMVLRIVRLLRANPSEDGMVAEEYEGHIAVAARHDSARSGEKDVKEYKNQG